MTDGAGPKNSRAAIDWAHLSRQTMGDVELEAELLALFATQAAEFSGKLAAAASDKARLDLAHTLKGASRAIGAFPLGDAAEDYESAIAEPPRLRALEARLAEAQQAIASRLKR
ncbi:MULTISPECIES: Hpt domain-containing protein [Methylosinus]|nr:MULTISPECIES: Hpt domain-containing protein [Methylosinus]MBU3890144.1 Hpt domain-containing protein [Methylosinus sp. KRF6]